MTTGLPHRSALCTAFSSSCSRRCLASAAVSTGAAATSLQAPEPSPPAGVTWSLAAACPPSSSCSPGGFALGPCSTPYKKEGRQESSLRVSDRCTSHGTIRYHSVVVPLSSPCLNHGTSWLMNAGAKSQVAKGQPGRLDSATHLVIRQVTIRNNKAILLLILLAFPFPRGSAIPQILILPVRVRKAFSLVVRLPMSQVSPRTEQGTGIGRCRDEETWLQKQGRVLV